MLGLSSLLEEKGNTVIPFAMQHKDNLESDYSKYFPSFVDTLKPGVSPNKLKTVGRMFYSFEAKRKLKSLINKEKPDIAHIHNIYHQISPSILPLLKKQGIPLVMTVHDYKLVCPNYILYTKGSTCEKCRGKKYCQAFYNRCLKDSYLASALVSLEMHLHKFMKVYEKNIDLFITPSIFVKEKLVKFGMNSEKIIVLPHFIKSKSISPEYNNGKYLLYAGRLKKEKGVNVLIEAMRSLPQVELRIAGSGPEEAELKNQARGLNSVKFVGHIPKSEIADIYRRSLAVVIPSRVWETFGLSAAESMAFGKPVIAAKMGALPELVENNKTGLLFESENPEDLVQKLKFIVDNPALAQEMGKAGRSKVEALMDPEKHVQKIIEVYEKLRVK